MNQMKNKNATLTLKCFVFFILNGRDQDTITKPIGAQNYDVNPEPNENRSMLSMLSNENPSNRLILYLNLCQKLILYNWTDLLFLIL